MTKPINTIKVPSTADLIAKLRARQQAAQALAPAPTAPVPSQPPVQATTPSLPALVAPPAAHVVQLNQKQLQAVSMAMQGLSFCLIGSAGTGKTTAEVAIIKAAVDNITAKLQLDAGSVVPSQYVRVVAFTRRAVRNCVKAIRSLGQQYINCAETVHSALKYQPVFTETIENDEDGMPYTKRSMHFEPTVTAQNPDLDVRRIIVDEASMLGYQGLYAQLREGFPNAKFTFIGDLNQLRPVMDDPTLAYALGALPVIELTEVYRQALDSPIVRFQYEFTLAGLLPKSKQLSLPEWNTGATRFVPMPFSDKLQDSSYANLFVRSYILPSIKAGTYNPDDCIILLPYGKSFGSILVNEDIALHLGLLREATVHHVIAGINHKYLAVGDYVLHDKRECEVVQIEANMRWEGAKYKTASKYLSRHGDYMNGHIIASLLGKDAGQHAAQEQDSMLDDVFNSTSATPSAKEYVADIGTRTLAAIDAQDEESTQRSASHIITLKDRETGKLEELTTTGDIGKLDWSYALTIHKSQGSEWRKVYLVCHSLHKNLTREMLYTGMTRAKEELVVFYSNLPESKGGNTVARSIKRQDIKGATWKEKAASYMIKQIDEGTERLMVFPD